MRAADIVIRALAQMANVNVVFDPAFRPHADHRSICATRRSTRRCASITGSTQNFFRVTAPRTITIIPDTPAKRREYEEEVVRTFYLSNADLKETMDMLRIVIDARRIGAIAGDQRHHDSDTPERITRPAASSASIDKARPEVMIDVELLEVNRTRLTSTGCSSRRRARPASTAWPTSTRQA